MQKWTLQSEDLELDPGERAYIYQQLTEFEPFLLHDSSISVNIGSNHQVENHGVKDVFITITVTGDGANVSVTSSGKDMYSATRDAKEKLLDFLHQVQQEVLDLEDTGS